MFERCLQGRSHHYNKCCNNEKHIKKNRKPSKHIVPICAHCTSMWLCVYGACGWILSGRHSMQKDQVVSWCSAIQNHYSNQPVLKGIEGTEYAAFSVRVPAGCRSRLCDYVWPNDAFCTSFICHFHSLWSFSVSQWIEILKSNTTGRVKWKSHMYIGHYPWDVTLIHM